MGMDNLTLLCHNWSNHPWLDYEHQGEQNPTNQLEIFYANYHGDPLCPI
jgi:hypothetical protein